MVNVRMMLVPRLPDIVGARVSTPVLLILAIVVILILALSTVAWMLRTEYDRSGIRNLVLFPNLTLRPSFCSRTLVRVRMTSTVEIAHYWPCRLMTPQDILLWQSPLLRLLNPDTRFLFRFRRVMTLGWVRMRCLSVVDLDWLVGDCRRIMRRV